MVQEQLVKLQQEKADRARDGAATPPSPAQPTDPVDTRWDFRFWLKLLSYYKDVKDKNHNEINLK